MKQSLLLFIALLSITSLSAQDLQSYGDLKKFFAMDLVSLEDTLANRGFVFVKMDGLESIYKRKETQLVVQSAPKQITYTTLDRKFFLKMSSELQANGLQQQVGNDSLMRNGKWIKASTYASANEKVALFTFDDSKTKKTYYGSQIAQGEYAQEKVTPKEKAKVSVAPTGLFGITPYTNPKANPANPSNKAWKKVNRNHFYFGIGGTNFYDPEYGPSGVANVQAGFQKSKSIDPKYSKGLVKDFGKKIDASVFFGMDYGWRTDPGVPYSPFTEYITLSKYYLGYNEYLTLNFKVVDLKLEGGAYLNYNYATGLTGSAGFMTAAWHFGEHIIRPFNYKKKGNNSGYIGAGFDQYIAIKGGYIGCFGFKFGF
ncbi:MAG: hypothetical protein CFE21_04900 [Bacteroidetes bacterium B1(2017)]|nr:MAG: hypothetical protein CFE21_04900 [Bacteroidetes bacterium B1(2017)]